MAKIDQKENREMVIQAIESTDPSDVQIIEMLLLLLDDWEVRSAIMKCVQRRPKNNVGTSTSTTTVSSSNKNGSQKT